MFISKLFDSTKYFSVIVQSNEFKSLTRLIKISNKNTFIFLFILFTHFAPGKIHDRYSGSADEINEFYDPGDYPVTVSFFYSLPEGENDYSGQSSRKLSAEFSFKIVGDGKTVIHTGSSITDQSEDQTN